jgi:hypothetical protein
VTRRILWGFGWESLLQSGRISPQHFWCNHLMPWDTESQSLVRLTIASGVDAIAGAATAALPLCRDSWLCSYSRSSPGPAPGECRDSRTAQ